jgi:hypothetical protein
MDGGGWRHLVPVEEDRERGNNSVEGRRRCGVLRGQGAPLKGWERGSKAVEWR